MFSYHFTQVRENSCPLGLMVGLNARYKKIQFAPLQMWRGVSFQSSLLFEVNKMSIVQQMCTKSYQTCLLPQSDFSATGYHLEMKKHRNNGLI